MLQRETVSFVFQEVRFVSRDEVEEHYRNKGHILRNIFNKINVFQGGFDQQNLLTKCLG